MRSPWTITLGEESLEVRQSLTYRSRVLTRRRESARGPRGSDRSLWDATTSVIRRACSRDRLFPPLLFADDGPSAGPGLAFHLLPEEVGLLVGGTWKGLPGSLPSGDLLLSGVATLAGDLCAELSENRWWLSDRIEEVGVYLVGGRLGLLPGPLIVPDEARDPSVFRRVPGLDREEWNAATMAELLAQLLRALALAGDASSKPQYDDLARRLERGRPDSFAAIRSAFADLAPYAISPLPEVVCLNCNRTRRDEDGVCSTCEARPPRVNDDWRYLPPYLYHQQLGRKYCLTLPFSAGAVPVVQEINNHLQSVTEARVVERLVGSSRDGPPALMIALATAGLPAGATEESLSRRIGQLCHASPSAPVAIPVRNVIEPLGDIQLSQERTGVSLFWPMFRGREVVFKVWWSEQPLPEKPSSELDRLAGSDRTEVNSYTIRLEKPTTIHVAVGAFQYRQLKAYSTGGPFAFVLETAAPVPAPSPASITCPQCKTVAPPGREFCPGCGGFLDSSAEPPVTAEDRGEVIEESGDCVRRRVASAAGTVQVLDMGHHAALTNPLAGVYPQATVETPRPGRLRLTVPDAPGMPLTDWARRGRTEADFYDRLRAILLPILAGLEALHARGLAYAKLLPDRITVEANGRPRLDWPLTPQPLGKPVSAPALLGYTIPGFGRSDRACEPSWDLFALGTVLVAVLSGKRPPECLSDADTPLPNPRLLVPDLPVGWAGFLHALLARTPSGRFASARQAAEALRLATGSAPVAGPLRYRLAIGQHIGLTKSKSYPKNQDRVFAWLPGLPADLPRESYPDFDPQENFRSSTIEGTGPLLVGVSDGISTVDAGEFAAEVVAAGVADWMSRRDASLAPELAVEAFFDDANRRIGLAMLEAIRAGRSDASMLNPRTSPSATLLAAMFDGSRAAVACLGDSRAYLLRAGVLEQLTVDGDQATVYVRRGMSMDQVLLQDDAKELVGWIGRFETRRVGNSAELVPDRPVPVASRDGFWKLAFAPQPGDLYCFCSDGISDYADAGQIRLGEMLARPPDEAVRALLDAANECGGHDNLSVAIVQVEAT